jgi:hypothetical protein
MKKQLKPNIMFTIVNNIENKVIANLISDAELINKVRNIAVENEDFDFSILGISDAKEYIEDYCSNLDLLDDYEVKKFLDTHGIEVEKNEPISYVELMMDNHKCTEWKGVQYYISDSLDMSEDEEKIYDVLAYALHV